MFTGISLLNKIILWELVLSNILIFVWYLLSVRRKAFWLLPFSAFNVIYLLNYPFKALFFVYPVVDPEYIKTALKFSFNDLLSGLVYSTVFYLVFNISAIWLLRKYDKGPSRAKKIVVQHLPKLKNFSLFVFCVICAIFFQRLSSLKYYGFGVGASYNLLDIAVANLTSITYLLFFVLLVLWHKTRSRRYLAGLGVLFGFVLTDSIFSTSKAPLVILLFIYFIYKGYVKEALNRKLLFGGLILIFFQVYYSYSARYFGNVWDKITVAQVQDNMGIIFPNFDAINDKVLSGFFNRFELMDNLVYIMKRAGRTDKGYFEYGSLIELLNVIPRYFWPSKPNLSIDYFLVDKVEGTGMQGVSAGMGIIGESFFVMGYAGILMGVVYSLLLFSFYFFFYHKSANLFFVLFYFHLYFNYFLFSDYLFSGVFSLLIVAGFLSLVLKLMPDNKVIVAL